MVHTRDILLFVGIPRVVDDAFHDVYFELLRMWVDVEMRETRRYVHSR